MSSNNTSTFQSTSFSFSSSTINGSTSSTSKITRSDPSGTKVHTRSQEPGQAPRDERIQYDASGRRIEDAGAGARGRIEDVTDEQEKRDKEYEERMEEEYAKREGGA
ncbi:hypothetical protein K458DRAFT_412000 [Lentithecium fluviatile CBS 122367]|uniref:Uncharacterized protein n=1 Tax=Lentithecium fluviatile CBS 122367 TaxID=1168545 RepID=A0A6G1JKF8_9PLEO|nr:hypothetical protein K458DRAFT_412000 [Lentithecium fluviatile CBS 122367]